jgi:hypothetical protein
MILGVSIDSQLKQQLLMAQAAKRTIERSSRVGFQALKETPSNNVVKVTHY